MRWKVTIEVRPVSLFPPQLMPGVGADLTRIEVTADSRLGAFSQAVVSVLAGMRASAGELLAAMRELREQQAQSSESSPPSEPAPTK